MIDKIIYKLVEDTQNNKKEMSKLVEEYITPTECQKRENAEVITPYNLRIEMLERVPKEFWNNKDNKVLEPCCGKFGFVLDIINYFMDGLDKDFPNKKERYEHIVTKCLYFADVEEQNVFTVRKLVDPYDIYKDRLNYNIGDTLKLNIKEKWNIENFNLVIANPPYNKQFKRGVQNEGNDCLES